MADFDDGWDDDEDDTDDSSDDDEDDEESDDDDDDGDDSDEDGEDSDDDDEDTLEDYEPPEVDGDVLGSRDEYPDADDEDFEEDGGDWTVDDYRDTEQKLFGSGEFFGDTAEQRMQDAGYHPAAQEHAYQQVLAQTAPAATETVNFFEKAGQVVLQGFVSAALLGTLQQHFPNADFSMLRCTVPDRDGETPQPRPLPPALAEVSPADKVDLRKYASPVGDQGQTSRCAAFAWTHALELVATATGRPSPRLSPSYTMLQFQKAQGDARDYKWAYQGGEGCSLSVECGEILGKGGTCRQDLWPDESPTPRADDAGLARDAGQYLLPASVQPIALDDVKKVLSAGCPVQVSMTTGPEFSDLGRDGVFDAAEKPSGQHGYHAMLIVGYIGNYYVVKNSWGADWGDGGYCYIPKKVLVDSEPELIAILSHKPAAAAPAREMVTCAACRQSVPSGKFCATCGKPLAKRRFCTQCGTELTPTARFCATCGTRVPGT